MSNANDTVCAIRKTRPPAASIVGAKISRRWLTCMFVTRGTE
nr:hypothetical protein [Pseudonocardia sp. ICBG601]